MARVRTQAKWAAQRLLSARDPAMPIPQDQLEFLDLIEALMRNRHRLNVTLSSRDMRCILEWNQYCRYRLRRDLAGKLAEEVEA